jgi:hypothetical protein
MARALASMAAALALVLTFSSTVVAARPDRVFLDSGTEAMLEGVCPFPVLVAFDRNKEYITTFSDGRTHITGQLFVTLTNTETGERHSYQISGPAVNTGDLNGQSIMFSFESWPAGGHLILTHGPVRMTWSDTGELLSYSLSGSSTDLCAVLS